jgi:hypothetical protein
MEHLHVPVTTNIMRGNAELAVKDAVVDDAPSSATTITAAPPVVATSVI